MVNKNVKIPLDIEYDENFLEYFNIINDVKYFENNKNITTILIDYDYEYQNILINQNVYIVHTYLELVNLLDFFLENKELLGD